MVDHGDKGYSVVATAERILRCYGMNVSQYELAQLAASHRKRGTSICAMNGMLRGASQAFKVRVREHYSLFGSRSFKQLVDRYNRVARRSKAPLSTLILKSPTSAASYKCFERDIQQAIKQGTPLLWSMQLGVFPEKESPQAKGGHMRLIIGYNAETNEVLFSDSWGLGHGRKRLPLNASICDHAGIERP